MASQIERVLSTDRVSIEQAIRVAHKELLALKERIRDLELLTAQARGILDMAGTWIPWPPLPAPSRPPTLHAAMAEVLTAYRNAWMAPTRIAKEIARRGLYLRRDGLPATPRDVSARVSTYSDLFERQDWYVRLRTPPPGTSRDEHVYLSRFDPWMPAD